MILFRYIIMIFFLFRNIGNSFIVNSPLRSLKNKVPLQRKAVAISEAYFKDVNAIKDKKEAKTIMARLNKELSKHDHLYHTVASPVISDAEYDRLSTLAENIAAKYPDLKNIVSKLITVGSAPETQSGLLPFEHSRPMLSLDNSFTEEGTKKFLADVTEHCRKNHPTIQSIPFVVEPKVDGLSLSVWYHFGKLVRAGTRGDGSTGEDVTSSARYLLDLPHTLKGSGGRAASASQEEFEVRGEVYITTADFEALNRQSASELTTSNHPFANARNAAAGTLRAHNSSLVADRKLRFVAYDIALSSKDSEEMSHEDSLDLLDTLGFVTPLPRRTFTIPIPSLANLDEDEAYQSAVYSLLQYCKQVELSRATIGYDTDGTVIKVNDMSVRKTLGSRRRSPRWALALKYSPKEAVTKLLGITVQVGRTGVLTPVAELAPVTIGGVRVERATLHNQQEINRLRLRPGCMVKVQRAGDVIPKVVSRVMESESLSHSDVTDRGVFEMPLECPVCGSPVVSGTNGKKKGPVKSKAEGVAEGPDDDEDEGFATHKCSGGYTCKAQVVERLKHFCSRKALDINGVGPAVAEYLHKKGWVAHPADLFTLHMKMPSDNSSAAAMDKGWGALSTRNLLSAIESKRSIPCHRLLFALGIPSIGEKTAKDISKAFENDFSALWEYLKQQADLQEAMASSDSSSVTVVGERILSIPGIGPKSLMALLVFASAGSRGERDDVERLMAQLHMQKSTTDSDVVNVAKGGNRSGVPGGKKKDSDSDRHSGEGSNVQAKSTRNVSSTSLNDGGVDETSSGESNIQHEQSPLYGKQIVFTGHLSSMSRTVAEQLCEHLGAEFGDSVTSSTNILVVPDVSLVTDSEGKIPSKKLYQAKKKGVQLMGESEWIGHVQHKFGADWMTYLFPYNSE